MEAARRFRGVQALRFAAALAVVWAHANDFAAGMGLPPGAAGRGALENLGAMGVDVFFVISGFIIVRTAARAGSAPEFFRARWLRIAPIYFLFSLPWAASALAAGTAGPDRWAATVLFWPSFGGGLAQPFLPIGWSLCFEMLFYAAVAVTLTAGRWRPSPPVLVGLYLACLGAGFAVGGPVFAYLGSPLILEFLAGAGLAVAFGRGRLSSPALGWFALAAAAVWLAALATAPDPGLGDAVLASGDTALRVLLWGVPAVLLVLAAVCLEPLLPDTGPVRAFVRLGDASYALYLSHLLVLLLLSATLQPFGPPGGADGWLLVCLLACTAAGAASHRYLEAPLQRMTARRMAPPPAPAAVVPG